MAGGQTLPFPELLPVDSEKRNEAVFVHADESLFAPAGLAESFQAIDVNYTADRQARLKFMADSVFPMGVRGTLGVPAEIHGSLEHDHRNLDARELLVVTSPLNDGPPESDAATMAEYVRTDNPDRAHIRDAKPNSWGPATKLDIGYELLNVEGVNMPVLQIFSRVPPRALRLRERAALLAGDHSGYGRVALAAVEHADKKLKEAGGNGIEKVHLFGAGMAHTAIATARYMAKEQDDYEVGGFTAMNPILGEGNMARMARDYSVHQYTGEPAEIIIPPGYVRIPEPLMRREIDGKGAEFAMRLRQARAMADVSYMWAMTRSKHTAQDIEDLMNEGIPGTIANAHNSSMTLKTRSFLPAGDAGLNFIDIVGIEGKKVGMMSNEHSALVALIQGIGLRNAGVRPPAPEA